jgi:hypothetical protein
MVRREGFGFRRRLGSFLVGGRGDARGGNWWGGGRRRRGQGQLQGVFHALQVGGHHPQLAVEFFLVGADAEQRALQVVEPVVDGVLVQENLLQQLFELGGVGHNRGNKARKRIQAWPW